MNEELMRKVLKNEKLSYIDLVIRSKQDDDPPNSIAWFQGRPMGFKDCFLGRIRGTIVLYTETINDPANDILVILLHEIAHAKSWWAGGENHDYQWMDYALNLYLKYKSNYYSVLIYDAEHLVTHMPKLIKEEKFIRFTLYAVS